MRWVWWALLAAAASAICTVLPITLWPELVARPYAALLGIGVGVVLGLPLAAWAQRDPVPQRTAWRDPPYPAWRPPA